MTFSPKRGCILWALICLMLAQRPVALSSNSIKASFPRRCLVTKLQVLNNEFREAEVKLLTRGMPASTLKKLVRIY